MAAQLGEPWEEGWRTADRSAWWRRRRRRQRQLHSHSPAVRHDRVGPGGASAPREWTHRARSPPCWNRRRVAHGAVWTHVWGVDRRRRTKCRSAINRAAAPRFPQSPYIGHPAGTLPPHADRAQTRVGDRRVDGGARRCVVRPAVLCPPRRTAASTAEESLPSPDQVRLPRVAGHHVRFSRPSRKTDFQGVKRRAAQAADRFRGPRGTIPAIGLEDVYAFQAAY